MINGQYLFPYRRRHTERRFATNAWAQVLGVSLTHASLGHYFCKSIRPWTFELLVLLSLCHPVSVYIHLSFCQAINKAFKQLCLSLALWALTICLCIGI